MKRKSFLFFLLPILALFLFLPTNAKALIVSYPTIELSAKPGETVSKQVRLENEGDKEITFYSSIYNFKSNNKDGKPELIPLPQEGLVDLASWIKVEKGPITLAPKQSKDIDITIDVPSYADPGGHYATVLWGDNSQKTDEKANLSINWKTGHLILLKVSGDVKEDVTISNFKVKKGYQNRLPIEFTTELQNTGNVHIKPVGQIEIKNIFGGKSGIAQFNNTGGNILPKSSREFDDAWIGEKNVQDGGFFQELRNEFKNFAIGRYTANIAIFYGNDQKMLEAHDSFWVLPWRVMLVALILLLIIFFLIKKYNKMVIKRSKK